MATDQHDLEIAAAYRGYLLLVRSRAQKLLGDASSAEDVAQDTFVRYLSFARGGATARDVAALLLRISTNLCLDRLRDANRRQALRARMLGRPEPHEDALEDRVALRELWAVTRRQEARIAAWYYVDGVHQKEIARRLGMQRRTVGRWLERFRRRAAKFLDDQVAFSGC